MTATFAMSPTYGQTVALGPVQRAVFDYIMSMTAGGRRPYVTLATMAGSLGRPVSSVHEALGRLRALGLIGCAARTGRTGGHRLWRVTGGALSRSLDVARHRRAVARIVSRWSRPVSAIMSADAIPPASTDTVPPPSIPPAAEGPSFRDRMRGAGFTPWWREDNGALHDDPPDDPELPPTLGI